MFAVGAIWVTLQLGAEPLPLKELSLVGTGLTDAGMQHICKGFGSGRLPSLERVELGGNAICSAGFVALAAQLSPVLTHLRMGRNRCGDVGMEALATALRECPKLVDLSFGHNNVGAAGFGALPPALCCRCCAER